jgi:hypothetical protein
LGRQRRCQVGVPSGGVAAYGMTTSLNPYRGFRFPAEIIQHAVWLYQPELWVFHGIKALIGCGGSGLIW